MRMPVFLLIIFKVLALAFVFSALQEQSAYADRGLNETPRSSWGFECEKGLAPGTYDGKRACVKCGGRNQPACEPRRVGKQCTASYTQKNSAGICEPRGGNNQPKLRGIGYDCRPGYNVGSNGKCQTCGGVGQVACESTRPGDRCTAAYTQKNSAGICEARGGNNQPKLRGIGYDCRPGYNVGSNGKCQTCGGVDQVACETTRPGDRCTAAYTQKNSAGICEARGGEGQPIMTGIGFDCRPGFNWQRNSDGDKYCTACGGAGQVACETTRPGERCTAAYTQKNSEGICEARGGNGQPTLTGLGFECRPGFNWRKHGDGAKRCEPCGAQGQPKCEEFRDGPKCEPGLKVDSRPGRNYCVADEPDEFDLVYEASKDKLREVGDNIFDAIVPMAFELHSDQDTLEEINDNDEDAAGDLEDDSRSFSELVDFKTLSVGATAEANFIIGVGVEGGVAFDITDQEKAMKWYSSFAVSNQLGYGSSYGAVLGIWNVQNNQLGAPVSEGGAKSVGVIFDVRTWLEFAGKKSTFLTDIGTQSSTATLLIGVWFERDEDVTEYEDLKFTGFTLSPVLGVGQNIAGTTYVEATTFQSRAPVTNETELNNLSSWKLAGGGDLQRCYGQCWVDGLGRERPDYLQTYPVIDDPSLLNVSTSGTRARTPAANSSSDVRLAGSLWMFEVQGNKFYLKVVDAASGKIVIQNVNSTNRVTYTQTSSGEYVANSGQRLSFESASAGEWISADGSRKYPMSRVN